MKKLIAAIMVSFMMLGLMTGCGAEKSFDGDILDVISFDMSKKEILENAEKELGKIDGIEGIDGEIIEDPMDAQYILYKLDSLYGYKGEVMLTFEWNLRTLKEIGILYEEFGNEAAEQQYKDILSQFTEIYGQSYENELGTPIIDTEKSQISVYFQNVEERDDYISIFLVPND